MITFSILLYAYYCNENLWFLIHFLDLFRFDMYQCKQVQLTFMSISAIRLTLYNNK